MLFLLTGSSFAHIVQQGNNLLQVIVQNNINQLRPVYGINPAIYVPNSMWTAGCCVAPNRQVESFAVIANNVQTDQGLLTLQIPVAQLQQILLQDVNGHNWSREDVDLFPGNRDCLKNNLPNLPPATI